MFNILHIGGNSILLRDGKILTMDHDPFVRRRDISLLDSGPRNPRCGGGRDKLH